MKTSEVVLAERRFALAERLTDYVELTKPRIAALVLLTVAVGAFMAGRGFPDPVLVIHAVLGTAMVASASSILNQLIERDTDSLMRRTARRPLPAGRVTSAEALALASILSIGGLIYLYLAVNGLTALVALVSLVLYVWVYTPLKRYTSLNTVVGAIPGALPPVIGWTAVTNDLSLGAWALFLIVFMWQFPHFLAIAWLYREDYARAGLRMLPTSDLGQRMTGVEVVSYCLALIPISLLPTVLSLTGTVYFWGTLVLGLQFLGYGIAFLLRPSNERARLLLWASLIYLPAVLALLMFDVTRY